MANKSVALTTRHWILYRLLKDNSKVWITEYFIYKKMKKFYKEANVNEKNFHDSFARTNIGRDILDLNNSEKIQKIIISGSNGVKIASKNEYKHWSDLKWASIKRMIKRLVVKDSKFNLDGQMKIIFGNSKARDYHKTFLD